MKLKELKPGTFFEFRQPGYNFRRCLWLGVDGFEQLSFVHLSASGLRFIHNDAWQDVDPEVTVEVPQSWDD